MYNRQLKTFLTVAGCGSFNKAAKQLYISAAAVIQQINSLEHELGVTLFHRSRQGISLTEAGSYLMAEGRDYVQHGDFIMEQLRQYDGEKPSILVGTSLEDKCRLLYDLWMMYTPGNARYDIHMHTLDPRTSVPKSVQLIESIRDGAYWQADWEFLEIFRVSYMCGVTKDHPFARKKCLTAKDLQADGVIVIDRSEGTANTTLTDQLDAHGISHRTLPRWNSTLIWECSVQKKCLLVPSCWDDVLFDLILVPFEIPYYVSYGFFYRENPSPAVRNFLRFVTDLYSSEDPDAIIPVL